jgi:hypothetical protein
VCGHPGRFREPSVAPLPICPLRLSVYAPVCVCLSATLCCCPLCAPPLLPFRAQVLEAAEDKYEAGVRQEHMTFFTLDNLLVRFSVKITKVCCGVCHPVLWLGVTARRGVDWLGVAWRGLAWRGVAWRDEV